MAILTSLALAAAAPLVSRGVNAGMDWVSNRLSGGSQEAQMPEMPRFEAPPTMDQSQALSQARSMVNPLYDRQLRDNLAAVDRSNISRGFYGQMPGDALARSTAADIETARAGQTANMTNQLMSQNFAQRQSAHQQMLNQQNMQQQFGLAQQQMGMQQRAQNYGMDSNLLNTGLNAYMGYHDRAGTVPFTGRPLPSQQVQDATGHYTQDNVSVY